MATKEDERNIKNNANVVNNAADVAIASKNPYAVAAGETVKIGDKVTGGKVSENVGKRINDINKHSPMGKKTQNMLNKASESGMADKAGKAARMYNGKNGNGSDLAKEPTGQNDNVEMGRGQSVPSSNANNSSDNSSGRNIAGLGPFSRKNNNNSNDNQNEKEEDSGLGLPKKIKEKLILILPIFGIAIFILFIIGICTVALGDVFTDPLGAATESGEDLGNADEVKGAPKEVQEYYERINDVKNDFMEDEKYFDTTQIVAVFKKIMEYDKKLDYDDISKSEIKRVANAMFNENVYDEEYFKENLKNDIIPSYINNITPEETEELVTEMIEYVKDYYEYIGKDENGGLCSTSGSCQYSIKGFSINGKNVSKQMNIDNLRVRLMQCGPPYGTGKDNTPIDQPLVDFEDYIAGVVYAEIGESYPIEAIKAQAIMARSYALARPTAVNNAGGKKLTKENGQWILQIASCVSDQVFCNVNEGCSYMGGGDGQGGYVVSGINKLGSIRSKKPLSSSSKLRTAVASTKGELLIDAQGYVISTGYTSTRQNSIKSLADSGSNYKEILFKTYSNAKDISKSNCTGQCTPSSGEYANWKQCDSRWGNKRLGSTTICRVGCLATSIAILIAKSGVPTTVNPFDPGTFVTRMNEIGGFINDNLAYAPVSKIAPKFVFEKQLHISGYSRQEKLNTIKTLLSQGYYLSVEVKGNTGQHWVAIDNVNGDTINMMDPASKATNMWAQYSWSNTSTINCFKVR